MSGHAVIIDEDRKSAESVAGLFRPFGIAVHHYDDPKRYLTGEHFASRHAVLIDMGLSAISSLDLIRIVVEKSGAIAVFAMANHPTIALAVQTIKAGADDFLEKPISISPVVSVLQNPWTPSLNLAGISDAFVKVLTGRELEVVAGLLEGGSSKYIGRVLGISHRTVEVHRRHIFKKLHVTNISELILCNRSDTQVRVSSA